MVDNITNLGTTLLPYLTFLDSFPSWVQHFLNLFFWSSLVVLYAIFVWKLYRWIAKKDILELNLARYNTSKSILAKLFGGVIYFLEYIIILPFIVSLWFAFFTTFMLLLTDSLAIDKLLFISVIVVTAIRVTAYYKEDLSRDIAKLFPLTLLGVAVTQGLFSFERVINQISLIPQFFSDLWIYLLFIVAVEFFLRFLDIIFLAFDLYDESEVESADTLEEVPRLE